MQTNDLNLLERFNKWLKESITVKLVSIGFLLLILLIPSAWIQSLIEERQTRAESVINEISDKWSGSQTVSGPVLVIPYQYREKVYHDKDNIEIQVSTRHAFFLPETLAITGGVKSETLHRGIFESVVYESDMNVQGTFETPDFKSLNIAAEDVLWSKASLIYSITDLRGISDNPVIMVGKEKFTAEPSNNIGVSVRNQLRDLEGRTYLPREDNPLSTTGIVVNLQWTDASSFNEQVTMQLKLKGSSRLGFIPVGKTTTVHMEGPWTDPSFDGDFLPVNREISEKGFTADWKVLHFNRPFAQQWKDREQELSGAEFGLKLLIPVDQYQKSVRTSKYAILIILLTFIAMFLVEITQKVRIHPFQYILIGAALIIYYTLLLSMSEHVGYNVAYGISSLATVALITAYATSFLKARNLVTLFASVLVIFYGFIFVIILQQDYSLLIGSVGLFLIIGVLMYFSRRINWYKES